MALDDIKQHIATKAQTEADKIKKESNEQIEQLQLEWQNKIEAEKKRLLSEIERKAESKLAQAKFKIREQINAEKLRTKQAQIDQVYQKALQSLTDLSDADYKKLTEKLLKSTKGIDGEVVENKDKAGFVFRTKETDMDFTFETLIKQVREQTLVEVHHILFE